MKSARFLSTYTTCTCTCTCTVLAPVPGVIIEVWGLWELSQDWTSKNIKNALKHQRSQSTASNSSNNKHSRKLNIKITRFSIKSTTNYNSNKDEMPHPNRDALLVFFHGSNSNQYYPHLFTRLFAHDRLPAFLWQHAGYFTAEMSIWSDFGGLFQSHLWILSQVEG